jgi:hypothetical protein
MDIWQRGTTNSMAASTTRSSGFGADRFQMETGANQATTISRQSVSDTTNLPSIQYCTRIQRNSGQTGTGTQYYTQSLETANSIPLVGKTVTLSFYARAGANYSPTSSILKPTIWSNTTTDSNVWAGGWNTVTSSSVTLTTTWQRFSVTGTITATQTQIAIGFEWSPTGTAGANDYYEVTGVQLELGSIATTFSRAGGTIQGELAACQRYHHRFSGEGSATAALINSGLAFSTTVAMFIFNLGTTMRTGPGTMQVSNQGIYRPTNATAYSGGTWSLNQTFDNSVRAIYTHGSAIFVAGESLITSSTTTSNYFAFDAEL